MKRVVLLLLACVVVCRSATAQLQEWPIIVHNKPFHVGDFEMKFYEHPKPDGKQLKCTFEIKGTIFRSHLYIMVWVAGMMPKTAYSFKSGRYHDRLYLNGKELAVLNKRVKVDQYEDACRIDLQVKTKYFKRGKNEILIKSGRGRSDIDDFEIYKIMIAEKKLPPEKKKGQ